MSSQTATLPVLRPDVEFHLGPDDPDGAPTYVLHDPLRGTFEKLTWVQAEILRRLRVPLTLERLLEHLNATTIKVSGEDVRQLCADVARRGLTTASRVADARAWQAQRSQSRVGGLTGLFRRSVFLRLPLIRPDAFLERTVGLVRVLARPVVLGAYLCLALIGVTLLVQRFDAYLATFPYFFNAAGVAAFTLAIAVVKVIHEFSHAYVAKAMGNRVPTMGIALIFLFPVAYADVTDSWRMRSRRRRMLIGLAGVIAELALAGLALFVWALSPPGLIKSICFVVSSATLLSTLLVNLNPAMRFDGYYVASDLLGIDNLQSRSFAVMRWVIRRHVLGIAAEPPEIALSSRHRAVMVAYAAFAWTYRLFAYSGIALMLYHRVTKVVGGLLFVLAIYTFLIKPVVTEMINILRMRARWCWNPRMAVATAIGGALVCWVTVPLPRWRAVPAATTARAGQVIYSPGDGVMREIRAGLNTEVTAGQVLFTVESDELEHQSRLARLEIERIRTELAIVKNDEKQRGLLPQKTEELARATARLESILTAIDGARFVTEVDGRVVEWDESARDGMPLGARRILGRIVDHRGASVICYVKHDLVADVAVGNRVYFCSDADPGRLDGSVTFIDRVRTDFLEHRGLSSIAGGDIAVTVDGHGRLEVVDSYYAVEVTLDRPEQPLRVGQTGKVWVRTAPRSRLADLFRYTRGVLIRESSL